MSHITLTPAYGRDYRNKQEVKADFEADKDFLLQDFFSPYDGKPINKSQILPGKKVNIRYSNLRKVAVLTV